ncbi:MAG: bifunctional proline dehydrogenase/L-glutamate gamma-semialdehyde dehydrogenase PutA [Gammaproteobacteria bacterium]|nr:bifunctional proline dehydrogenase/L-glutamate gamma-semialdehyde dehydrogenase PutA [Gammaproteobacteria bacterium]
MIFSYRCPKRDKLRQAIFNNHVINEANYIPQLIKYIDLKNSDHESIKNAAIDLVTKVRKLPHVGMLDAFLKEYDLSTEEGVTIMCIAESILRIPDAKTGNALIQDKLTSANWDKHIGHSRSLFVNASTWAFLFTGQILHARNSENTELQNTLSKILSDSSKPVIRQAILQAIKSISNHFIIGNEIQGGFKKSRERNNRIYRYSFDMLGEAAITSEDADKYFEKYLFAIRYLNNYGNNDPIMSPGVSIKLSALHPRYEFAKYSSVFDRLYPRLKNLAKQAKQANINFVIDAEETDRLDLQLDLFETLCHESCLQEWNGLGLAIQAYQKRAFYVIDWLSTLAKITDRRIMVRLVKGAYWDSEIKRAQLLGLENYPVFTRKESTDISYLACAKNILNHTDDFYPMFATHNAHTISAILNFAGNYRDFEFQRLYGMGEQLYSFIVTSKETCLPCRVYAPCGKYKELLPYLVRRLLENGANTSFVNRILDTSIPVKQVVADPILTINKQASISNPKIPLPPYLYYPHRINSHGLDLTQETTLLNLREKLEKNSYNNWRATSIVNGQAPQGIETDVYTPSNKNKKIGAVIWATKEDVDLAIQHAQQAFSSWHTTTPSYRANCLIRAAELLESHADELIALCILEAGKTIANAVAEVREAVDYCRYYAHQANRLFRNPSFIAGSTIKVDYIGCGVFACISPWNFPLAIFLGQIVAALVAGNTAVAKPAKQAPLIAAKAVQILHQAGIPPEVLHLIIGDGKVGAAIVNDYKIAGVVFTGSTMVAREISKALNNGHRCCMPLIAETGGINAMVIDSSALLEQAVVDVIQSAFDSAGQRCSALRVVYVQEAIAEEFLRLLKGAMAELEIGDPSYLAPDIGPIIDQKAKRELEQYEQEISKVGQLIYKSKVLSSLKEGNFFAPCAYEIESIKQIKKEAFGPILHVIRYAASKTDGVLNEINSSGYGLTFGVHSRINSFTKRTSEIVRAGNIYINRNMIGATVGIQPFGGERMSGTGPKAGGPHYLYKFTRETRTVLNHSHTNIKYKLNSNDLCERKEYSIEPSIDVDLSDECENITLLLKHIIINASVKYSNEEHAKRAIQLAENKLTQFDSMENEQRADYLNHIYKNLDKYRDEIISIYSSEFSLERNVVNNELEQAISVASDYKNNLDNNSKHIIFEFGPTGERNELELHNRGVFVFFCDKSPILLSFTSALAATISIGNPLLVIANKNTLFTTFCLANNLIHPKLYAKYIYYLPVNDQGLVSNIFTDNRISGYIYFNTKSNLINVEKLVANREGPLVSLIADLNNQATGGPLANTDNLFLISAERTITTNTTAIGGNAALYCMGT